MTVSELIELLKTKPQDLHVIYDIHSEMCLLEPHEIQIMEACKPRPDGWVHRKRCDQPTQTYLCFPGN